MAPPDSAPTIALVGPTGTGKTAVSLHLAEQWGADIVCADSRQLYRGLEVATGKPDALERARAPHHLFDLLDPREPASAGRWAEKAFTCVRDIHARGRAALLVGGTGLYVRALWRGLVPVPAIEPALRRSIRHALAERGAEALHRELIGTDPVTAARLSPRDGQRIARALEVARGTGRPLSEWIAAPERTPRLGSSLRLVGLARARATLYPALDERTRSFFAGGLLEEVSALLAAGVPHDAPAFTGIGYAEAVAHLRGEMDLEAAIQAAQHATRRYAKRQETWWRGEEKRTQMDWVSTDGLSLEEVSSRVQRALDP